MRISKVKLSIPRVAAISLLFYFHGREDHSVRASGNNCCGSNAAPGAPSFKGNVDALVAEEMVDLVVALSISLGVSLFHRSEEWGPEERRPLEGQGR